MRASVLARRRESDMGAIGSAQCPTHAVSRRGLLLGGLGGLGVLALRNVRAAPASAASGASRRGPSVAMAWDATVLEAIRRTRLGPPMVARALALVHTAMYDAWAAYDSVALGTRLADLLRRPAVERTAANKAEAVSHAAYLAAVDLFPSQRALF